MLAFQNEVFTKHMHRFRPGPGPRELCYRIASARLSLALENHSASFLLRDIEGYRSLLAALRAGPLNRIYNI